MAGRFSLTSPAAPGTAGAQASWSQDGIPQTTSADISAATTLEVDDSGAIFSVNQTGGYAITLPTPAGNDGINFEFMISTAAAATVAITAAGGSFVGTIVDATGCLIATAATSIDFDSGCLVGDTIKVTAVNDLWLVQAFSAAAAGTISRT